MSSRLGALYTTVYDSLCGRHPDYRPWHYQWLFLRQVHRWQRARMRTLHGRVLDLGCGAKPYAAWVDFGQVAIYVGADVVMEAGVDVVVDGAGCMPFADDCFDALLCTQVLEHVTDRDALRREMIRVLKPGGRALITVPFLYPVHGRPHDYARFTVAGVERFLGAEFWIEEARALGGAGTTFATLLLTWIENSLNRNAATRVAKGLALPLWLMLTVVMNALGVLVDAIDGTATHYANACVLAVKRETR